MASELEPQPDIRLFEGLRPYGSPHETAAEFIARSKVHELREFKKDIKQEALEFAEANFGIMNADNIVEFGCFNLSNLINLRKRGYTGHLTGVDTNSLLFLSGQATIASEGLQNISTVIGDAEDLSDNIEDESADVVMAFNMLHEVKNPERAIAEAHRMLKPEGLFIVTLWGKFHIGKHRSIERGAAQIKGFQPPEIRSRHFNNVNAEEVFPSYFNERYKDNLYSPIPIKPTDEPIYIGSLDTRRGDFRDSQGNILSTKDWKAIRWLMSRFVANEIRENGFLHDDYDQWAYVLQKDPQAQT